MYHKAMEAGAIVEEQLEALLEWSEVPDLMMETREELGQQILLLRGKEMK